MFFKTYAALALATGFAAAKPISRPAPEKAMTPRNVLLGNNGQAFNFIDGFNTFNNQNQVLQIQENNLQLVNNGFQQQVVQQARQVLVLNQQNFGFNSGFNNLFRKANFKRQFPQVSTVMLVVQEIQVSVDNGFGQRVDQNVFAQSVVVANRGFPATQTVMVFAQETLIAQDFFAGGKFANIAGFNGDLNAFDLNNNVFNIPAKGFNNGKFNQGFDFNNNGIAAFPTATADIQLFGARPTWSSVVEDPAATLGAIWQAELDDLNKVEFNGQDNGLNGQISAEEKKALDEQLKQQQEQEQNAEQEQQNAEQEQQNADQEQKQNEEEQQNAEQEQQKNEEQQAAAEGDQQQQQQQQA
ncbi:uncharacterized protein EI97DRAFT_459945 [Westerdykella ornata]|uniref:Uncharacterized protein n=1 Tax=Westerdykella ornata TaxID=318751 RepID=A0A6A6JEH6_WESOR|nr:uncharacterized protein EI97DRAFT_459945 [Westerdykella ornata]KAF2274665.1 hypothetical protein EI97DRAFT_459945 [Westerdykella ornata]